MKIKPIKRNKEFINTIRNNAYIEEYINEIYKGEYNSDKEEYGNIALLSLMDYYDYISPFKDKNKTNSQVFKKIVSNSLKVVKDYEI